MLFFNKWKLPHTQFLIFLKVNHVHYKSEAEAGMLNVFKAVELHIYFN